MNDDKVLDYLKGMEARIDSRFEKLETEIAVIKVDVAVIKKDITVMQKDITVMQKELTYTKTRVENLSESVAVIEVEHGKMLGALSDGYSLMSDNMNQLLPLVDKVKNIGEDVAVIKSVVSNHAVIFNKIKTAI